MLRIDQPPPPTPTTQNKHLVTCPPILTNRQALRNGFVGKRAVAFPVPGRHNSIPCTFAMPTAPRPSPWRRLAAYLIDYVLIMAYLGVVTVVAWGLNRGVGLSLGDVNGVVGKQAIIFCVLTLPVILYFAILESRPNGATVGKRFLRVQVRSTGDEPARLARTLIRAAVKFAPWEVAHTAIWRLQTDTDDPTIWPVVILVLVLVLVLVVCLLYVGGLFLGRGCTLYDLSAGTRVISVDG